MKIGRLIELTAHRWARIQSNWKRDQSNEAQESKWKIEEWSNSLSVIADVLLEAMINLVRNKASGERWERDRTYSSAVTNATIETTIYSKINKWSKSDWAYFSAMNDDPNEATINLERNKGFNETFKSYWNYPSTMDFESNLIEVIINLERNKGLNEKSQSDWTFQFVADVSIETDIYTKTIKWLNEKSKWSNILFVGHQCFNKVIGLSREKQAIELNIEGRSSLLLSDDWRIEFNGDNNHHLEKIGLEWKFIKWTNSLFRDRMSLVFHVM
jgi:hypothetical protein